MPMIDGSLHSSSMGSPSGSIPSVVGAAGTQFGLQSSIAVADRIFFMSPYCIAVIVPASLS